jgi:transcriptional regulator with XRE-family HTH domain
MPHASCIASAMARGKKMTEQQAIVHPTLAEKIDRLFTAIRPEGRREYSYEEVSAGIRQRGITPVSNTTLWELRTGKLDNPKMRTIEALADFFGVPITYFFANEPEAARLYAQLALLPAHQDSNVQRIALRAADLSPDTLKMLGQIVEQVRHLEGIQGGRQGLRQPRVDNDREQQREAEQEETSRGT